MPDDYTSILDKTDWRKTIHKALQDAVFSIGKEDEFFYNVEQAIAAIKAIYPNWNATKEIDEMLERVTKKYQKIANDWIEEHKLQWAYPWNRAIKLYEWRTAMYMEILQELKDIAGKHRMLLWGIRSLPEGQMESKDSDVTRDEVDS